jgi:predicted phage tail protein
VAEKKYNEKDEKQFDEKDEKELLKHDEKVEQQDILSSIVWAAILIWAGIAFLSVNMGWFDAILGSSFFARILPENMAVFEPGVWSIIMLGAGIILLVEVAARLLIPAFHRHVGGSLIVAAVFIGVGLGNFFGRDLIWPFILISVGISILLSGITRRHS